MKSACAMLRLVASLSRVTVVRFESNDRIGRTIAGFYIGPNKYEGAEDARNHPLCMGRQFPSRLLKKS
jgi:hypothetical protein